ncbi:MAG: phenylacetate--CoA ligase family protein [Burkholderiales bacterium]|nr:phenylacetate--CoA ligase family protein [Burkholderiales bacterium]
MLRRLVTGIAKLREYERNERLTRAELEARKLAKFRTLAGHAQRHSPYYAQVIREQRIDVATCAPGDFPELTRSLLIEHFDRIATDRRITRAAIGRFLESSDDASELFLGKYHVLQTSGSSGATSFIVYSETDWARGMAQTLRRGWAPWGTGTSRRPRRFRVAYYGALGGHFGGVAMVSGSRRAVLRLLVRTEMIEINDPLGSAVARLNAFTPDLLIGYVVALKALAGEQLAGRLRIKPCAINAGGETMTPSDRELLERAFACPVRSSYGATEFLMMGLTAPGTSIMVLYDDDLHYEIRDDHCLVTNLYNRTLPLIRYRMSDILRPAAGPSPVPPYLAIDDIIGRSEIVPLFRNEVGAMEALLPFSFFAMRVPSVHGFQLVLQDGMRFQLRICPDPALDATRHPDCVAATRREVAAILERKRMRNVDFDVVIVAALPPDPRTRKLQLVVDARSRSEGEGGIR